MAEFDRPNIKFMDEYFRELWYLGRMCSESQQAIKIEFLQFESEKQEQNLLKHQIHSLNTGQMFKSKNFPAQKTTKIKQFRATFPSEPCSTVKPIIQLNIMQCYNSQNSQMFQIDEMIRVGIVGQAQVGKTSFINKFLKHSKQQHSSYSPTIAVQISYAMYECQQGTKIRVKIWDTSGQTKYKGIVPYHLKDVDAIIVLYDLTDYSSFQKVPEWIDRLKKENVWPVHRLLVGNKYDYIQEKEDLRKVKVTEGEQLAASLGAKFREISCEEIHEMFENIMVNRAEQEIRKKKKNLIEEGAEDLTVNESSCQCELF